MNYGKESIMATRDPGTSNRKKNKKRTVRAIKVVLIAFLVILVTGLGLSFGFIKGLVDSAPDVSTINVAPSKFATVVYDVNGKEVTRLVQTGSNRDYVTIDKIPDCVQKAFIAIEDERFYAHNGVDIQGIIRAFIVGISRLRFNEGASTITQQLIKNNVLTDWTSESTFLDKIKRKIQEQFLAIQIEKKMSKETILEYYLNSINLGQNCLGVQTASKRYFDKDVSELTISEAAVIAAITQNPTGNNPITNPDNNNQRREKVLNNMYKHEYITQSQLNDALADDVYSRVLVTNPVGTSLSTTSYFTDELIEQVAKALKEEKGYSDTQAYNAIYSGGLQIYSTQDMEIQKICDEEANNDKNYPQRIDYDLSYRLTVKRSDGSNENFSENDMIKYFKESNPGYTTIYKDQEQAEADIETFKKHVMNEGDTIPAGGETKYYIPQPQTSVTVMDQSTGQVRAIVGGRGEKIGNMTLNRATQTTKQPGSCFKVLAAFAPALDTAGVTLATAIQDAPYSYSNGRPVRNWWGDSYRGFVTVREAITQSMNIIAVKTITEITPQLGFEYLLNFGFTTLVDHKTLEDGSIISDIGQPTALGGISMGVKNVEITAAYASIANKGTYVEPTYFTKILDSQGNVLLEKKPTTKQVLKEQTAYLLTSAMQDVMTKGTGASACLANMPCAGKTGTTSENYDIWLCAYTPYYTCSVWGGYDVNTSLSNTGFHLAIWRSIMTRIHSDLPVKNFTMPSGIVTANICKKCGKLAIPGLCDMDPRGSMVVTELFMEGTEPTEPCTCHVDSDGSVYQVLPEGASGGTADDPYLINSPYFIDEDGYYHYTDSEGNQMIAPPGSYFPNQELYQRRNPDGNLDPGNDNTNPRDDTGGNRGNSNNNNNNN
ncbi:MAG: transglycosylase domain-containing protein, partial [Lachnospiraceae bacterium]|nr:transglycosylase domain-containing protein [Lachnospiraceae bacterium]